MKIAQLRAFTCALAVLLSLPFMSANAQTAAKVSEQEAHDIAVNAYLYFYPLLIDGHHPVAVHEH